MPLIFNAEPKGLPIGEFAAEEKQKSAYSRLTRNNSAFIGGAAVAVSLAEGGLVAEALVAAYRAVEGATSGW